MSTEGYTSGQLMSEQYYNYYEPPYNQEFEEDPILLDEGQVGYATNYGDEYIAHARLKIAEYADGKNISFLDEVNKIGRFGGWSEYYGGSLLVRTHQIIDECERLYHIEHAPPLLQKFAKAVASRGIDILQVAAKINKDGNSTEVSLEEIARVQRDYYYLSRAIRLILQADEFTIHPFQDPMDSINGDDHTHVTKSLGTGEMPDGGQFFAFDLCNHSYNPEGDFEDLPEEEIYDWEEFHHEGKLKIFIREEGSNARINFTYLPYRPGADSYYQSHARQQVEGQEPRQFTQKGLRIAVDIDKHSPSGLSVDTGRGKWDGAQFNRLPDSAGKVFDFNGDGTHKFDTFEDGDLDYFKEFASWMKIRINNTSLLLQERDKRIDEQVTAKSERSRIQQTKWEGYLKDNIESIPVFHARVNTEET